MLHEHEILQSLAEACLEVHKTSADHREAKKRFREFLTQAFELGRKGANFAGDPKVTPRTKPAPPPQPEPGPAEPPKKPTNKPAGKLKPDPVKVVAETTAGDDPVPPDAKPEPTKDSLAKAIENL